MFGGRYRVEDQPIGRGGMGVVYKAFDTVAKRFVALKTLSGEVDRSSLELFEREWSVLAQLSHPNIVDVLDMGYYMDKGQQKPYFVMPLLPGCTLNALIKGVDSRLAVERVVEIICQACRGLQVAHDRGLVHRDLKPSNLFVMNDDTVKLIDFGIVHLTDTESKTSLRGTLAYMAPEQLEMKPASARSDIYSLGVVCYEALTGRKPFERGTDQEIVEAIRFHMPAPVSELNNAINEQISRAVHKAMAKQPYHRFSSAREFSDVLQRSLRNEHIEMFDRNRIQPRINRANRALTEGDNQLAVDILDELESEGNIDPEIPLLRMRAEQATRAKTIYQLIESARMRLEEQEYPLALQNVQRVLDIDPANIDALALKEDIERCRSATQIDKWLQIARQHYDGKLFSKARQAVDEVLRIDHSNRPAKELLDQISFSEQEIARLRKEKQQLYDSALSLYRNGEISSALKKLEEVIDLGKRAPGHPNTDAQYLAFYEQVRSERDELSNSYTEAKRAIASREFARALEICAKVLERRPGEPLFKALKIEAEDLQRQENSAAIAYLHNQIESEADLDRKFARLREAAQNFPDEQMFSQSLKSVKERRDLVNSVVSRARLYESQGLLLEAANQWDILRSVYPQYPGLDFEIQRLTRKQELQAQEEAKTSRIENVHRALLSGDYGRAEDLVRGALTGAPGNEEWLQLQKLVQEKARKSREAFVLVQEGNKLADSGDFLGAIEKLRVARTLDSKDESITALLCRALVNHARRLAEQNWPSAVPFVEEALQLNPADPEAVTVGRFLDDMRQREQIERYLTKAKQAQASQEWTRALEIVEHALQEYPHELELSQLKDVLSSELESRNAKLNNDANNFVRPVARALWATAGVGAALPASTPKPDRSSFGFDQESAIAPNPFSATRLFVPHHELHNATKRPTNEADGEREESHSPSAVSRLPELRPRRAQQKNRATVWALTIVSAAVLVAAAVLVVYATKHGHPSPSVVAVTHPFPPPPTAKQEPPLPVASAAPDEAKPVSTTLPPQETHSTQPTIEHKAVSAFSFEFASTPASARVMVDNEPNLTCFTPCSLQLSRGPHNVLASSPNYIASEQVIDVPDQTSASFEMHPQQRSIRFVSVPPGATIAIDGDPKGVTPLTLQLPLGTHRLALAKGPLSTQKALEVTPDSFVFTIDLGAARSSESTPVPEENAVATEAHP